MAEQRRMSLVEDDTLSEGTPFDLIDRLLRRYSLDDVLLCSHGDVIGAIITALEQRSSLAPTSGWPKASTWMFDSWPDPDRVQFLPAPIVP